MDPSKLKSAVLDLWRFSFPAVVSTCVLWFIIAWIDPTGLNHLVDRTKAIIRFPDSQTRDWLTFIGLNKLLPVITAFVVILLIYLIDRTCERIGESMPPTISFAPANLASRVIGKDLARRMMVYFRCHSDQELWDRAEQFAGSLERGKSLSAIWVEGSRTHFSAALATWHRSKFFVLWTVLVAASEWHLTGFRHVNWTRFFFALPLTSAISSLYFFKVLSAWKNEVFAVMHAAHLGITADPAELDRGVHELRTPDPSDRFFHPFVLHWRPAFLRTMEPELFFDLRRFPSVMRLLTGRKQALTERSPRSRSGDQDNSED